jgi:hypothetical protein
LRRANLLVLACSTAGLIALTIDCKKKSSGGGGESDVVCPQPMGCSQPAPGTTDLTSPTQSFTNDVVPIFEASCATSTLCHQGIGGSNLPSMSLLFLGNGPDAGGGGNDDAGLSPDTIIYVALASYSVELPGMPYVTAGDPENSYLMHKMDGDQCQFVEEDAGCQVMPASPTPCGAVMPIPCALPAAQRDTVRRWIAQGAMNN